MVHCMKHGAYDERLNLCPECSEREWIEGEKASTSQYNPKVDPQMQEEERRRLRALVEAYTKTEKEQPVTAPPHYIFGFGKLQTIDLIVEVLSKQHDPVAAYCLGNVLKYLTRFGRKDGMQDLKKAQQYLNWMIEYIETGKITHA